MALQTLMVYGPQKFDNIYMINGSGTAITTNIITELRIYVYINICSELSRAFRFNRGDLVLINILTDY